MAGRAKLARMSPRACRAAVLLALVLCAPAAAARSGVAEGLADLSSTLTLGAAPRGPALRALFLASVHPEPVELGGVKLGEELLRDPLALLELPEIPVELLGELTVQELGPIHGRVTDVPVDHALAAVALDDGPIPAESLRSSHTRGEVRDGTDAQMQQDDLAAMMGDVP